MTNEALPRARVLVIDDSDAARLSLRHVLVRAGYEVLELPSAIGATRMILRNQVRAVIVDITLPGLSGDRLVELLRGNPRLADLVIVVVSGDAQHLARLARTPAVDATVAKADIATRLEPVLARALSGAEDGAQASNGR